METSVFSVVIQPFLQRILTAAVKLAVKAVLLSQLRRAHLAPLLFEVRGQPGDSRGPADLFTERIDPHGVLVAGESQGRTEIVIAVARGDPRRLLQTQAEALGTAFAALRLLLESRGAGAVVLRPPVLNQNTDAVLQAHFLKQLQLGIQTAAIFLLRKEVGVIPQDGDVKDLRQRFQHRAGAGAAAAVQQHAGPPPSQAGDDFIQFFLIIPVHGIHFTTVPPKKLLILDFPPRFRYIE